MPKGWKNRKPNDPYRHGLSSRGITNAPLGAKVYKPSVSMNPRTRGGWNERVVDRLASMGTKPEDWYWTGTSKGTRDGDGTPIGVCSACDHEGCADLFLVMTKQGRSLWVGSECVENMMGANISLADKAKMQRMKKESKRRSKLRTYGVPAGQEETFIKEYDYNDNYNTITIYGGGYPAHVKMSPEVYQILKLPDKGTTNLGNGEAEAFVAKSNTWSSGKGQFVTLMSGQKIAVRGQPVDYNTLQKVKFKTHFENWGESRIAVADYVEKVS
jgi:hypothetical protein